MYELLKKLLLLTCQGTGVHFLLREMEKFICKCLRRRFIFKKIFGIILVKDIANHKDFGWTRRRLVLQRVLVGAVLHEALFYYELNSSCYEPLRRWMHAEIN